MKFSTLLFKPKWQDRDAGVRRQAVAGGSETELLAALPELARSDPDAGVRLAALRRLDDFGLWRERCSTDSDPALREAARHAYLERLCAAADDPPAPAQRLSELESLSSEEIEQVAMRAQASELRSAALQRVTRVALLAERAIADPDPRLRLSALARVHDPAQLKRIAERTRKTDKTISRHARDRLHDARIGAGDADAINARAVSLCERIEALVRAPGSDLEADLEDVEAQWQGLPDSVAEELQMRYTGARLLARRTSEFLQDPSAVDAMSQQATAAQAPAAETIDEPSPPPPPEPAVSAPVEMPAAASPPEAAARQRESVPSRQRTERAAFDRLFEDLEGALARGAMLLAHRLHTQLRAALDADPPPPTSSLRHRAGLVEARYAEMKRWQQWSNRQRRRELCADIEALVGSGIHPDALATRVREARDEWQRLDAAEGLDAEAATATGVARRFHALCHRALRSTRQYFSARKQVRHTHTEQTEELLAHLAEVADDCTDWALLARLRGEARKALHELDGVDPHARTELAKRLKQAIARLGTLCDAHDSEVAQAKQQLIDAAAALCERNPPQAAAREAKDLQKRWQALGKGARRRDQAQWRQFRTACNAVFERLGAERREHEARETQARGEAEQVLARLDALRRDPNRDADTLRAELRELNTQWRALNVSDRELSKRQRLAQEAITAAINAAERRRRQSRFTLALDRFNALRRIEDGRDPDSTAWQQYAACTPQFDAALAARLALRNDAPPAEADDTTARGLLVRLEFLAGLESPQEDRQLRLNHQVQRLSSRMRDASATSSPEQELESLMLAWFRQPPASGELEQRFSAAAQTAIQALP